MSLPREQKTLEKRKFKEDRDGNVAVNITQDTSDITVRLFTCMGQILEQLETMNKHLELLTDEEI